MQFCIRKKGTPNVPFSIKGQLAVFEDAVSASNWFNSLHPNTRKGYEVVPVKVNLTFYDEKE